MAVRRSDLWRILGLALFAGLAFRLAGESLWGGMALGALFGAVASVQVFLARRAGWIPREDARFALPDAGCLLAAAALIFAFTFFVGWALNSILGP